MYGVPRVHNESNHKSLIHAGLICILHFLLDAGVHFQIKFLVVTIELVLVLEGSGRLHEFESGVQPPEEDLVSS